jgi:predicted transcriptional regulator
MSTSPASPASPLPVSAHPSHISGISISVASLYPEFSLSNGSPSIGRDHQHDRLKSEVSEAEIIEVELFDDFDGDLESGSSEPVELDQQFAELSLKFKERIHDAERLQERCQRMLQLMEQSHMGLSSAQRKRASLARMKLHKL